MTRWFRAAFALAALIALHVATAQAAVIDSKALDAGRIAVARDASSAPASDVVLTGFTSQNYPTFFKVTGNGRKLTMAAISIGLSCTSGAQLVVPDSFARVRIGARGQLHSTFSAPPTALSDGSTVTLTDSLTARLNRRHTRVSGVWQLSLSFTFTNGMSDRCASGPVRFIATA